MPGVRGIARIPLFDLLRTSRTSVARKSVACIRQNGFSGCAHTLACIRFRNDPCTHPFSESLKTNIWIRTPELWFLLTAFYRGFTAAIGLLWGFTAAIGFHYPTLIYEGVYNRPELFLMQPEP